MQSNYTVGDDVFIRLSLKVFALNDQHFLHVYPMQFVWRDLDSLRVSYFDLH